MKILLAAATVFCGLLIAVHSAFAQTWAQTSAPAEHWACIASSADGSKLVAIANSSGLTSSVAWRSSDSGLTWVSNSIPAENWVSVASSADGTRLAAAMESDGPIYTSTNSGRTWDSNSTPNQAWFSVASSTDGNKLLAVEGSSVWTSTNAGFSWISNNVPTSNNGRFYSFWSVASSADGTKLFVVTYPGGLMYISTNSGLTWNPRSVPGTAYEDLVCSADGTKLVMMDGFSPIYTSTNSGTTWIANNVPYGTWASIASSADGTKLVGVNSGVIYTSTNSGTTWVSNSVPSSHLVPVASSADGSKLVAAGGIPTGGIYTLYSAPTPQLNLTAASSNLAFSWLVPSTNFVLQQNLDLSTTNWVTLTNTPTLNFANLQDEVALSSSNSSGFFRLMTQ